MVDSKIQGSLFPPSGNQPSNSAVNPRSFSNTFYNLTKEDQEKAADVLRDILPWDNAEREELHTLLSNPPESPEDFVKNFTEIYHSLPAEVKEIIPEYFWTIDELTFPVGDYTVTLSLPSIENIVHVITGRAQLNDMGFRVEKETEVGSGRITGTQFSSGTNGRTVSADEVNFGAPDRFSMSGKNLAGDEDGFRLGHMEISSNAVDVSAQNIDVQINDKDMRIYFENLLFQGEFGKTSYAGQIEEGKIEKTEEEETAQLFNTTGEITNPDAVGNFSIENIDAQRTVEGTNVEARNLQASGVTTKQGLVVNLDSERISYTGDDSRNNFTAEGTNATVVARDSLLELGAGNASLVVDDGQNYLAEAANISAEFTNANLGVQAGVENIRVVSDGTSSSGAATELTASLQTEFVFANAEVGHISFENNQFTAREINIFAENDSVQAQFAAGSISAGKSPDKIFSEVSGLNLAVEFGDYYCNASIGNIRTAFNPNAGGLLSIANVDLQFQTPGNSFEFHLAGLNASLDSEKALLSVNGLQGVFSGGSFALNFCSFQLDRSKILFVDTGVIKAQLNLESDIFDNLKDWKDIPWPEITKWNLEVEKIQDILSIVNLDNYRAMNALHIIAEAWDSSIGMNSDILWAFQNEFWFLGLKGFNATTGNRLRDHVNNSLLDPFFSKGVRFWSDYIPNTGRQASTAVVKENERIIFRVGAEQFSDWTISPIPGIDFTSELDISTHFGIKLGALSFNTYFGFATGHWSLKNDNIQGRNPMELLQAHGVAGLIPVNPEDPWDKNPWLFMPGMVDLSLSAAIRHKFSSGFSFDLEGFWSPKWDPDRNNGYNDNYEGLKFLQTINKNIALANFGYLLYFGKEFSNLGLEVGVLLDGGIGYFDSALTAELPKVSFNVSQRINDSLSVTFGHNIHNRKSSLGFNFFK